MQGLGSRDARTLHSSPGTPRSPKLHTLQANKDFRSAEFLYRRQAPGSMGLCFRV